MANIAKSGQEDGIQQVATSQIAEIVYVSEEDRQPSYTQLEEEETEGTDTMSCTCLIGIEGQDAEVLVDTGSSVTIVHERTLKTADIRQTRPPSSHLKSATGHEIPVTHEAKVLFNIGGQLIEHWAYISSQLLHEALIGYDFVTRHDIVIDGKRRMIYGPYSDHVPLQKTKQTMEVRAQPEPREATCSEDEILKPTAQVDSVSEESQVDKQTESAEGQRNEKAVWSTDDVDTGCLTPEQRTALLALIKAHGSCFSWDGGLGTCTLLEHRIELTTNDPVRRAGYKASHHDREIIEKEIRDMLEKDLIEPSVSAYAAGVVLVPKKNGETRFCVDYRGLNKVTKPDNYPIPLTKSEIFDTMGGAKIFSCLDCQQGYWQVRMAEEDRHKTAFRCHLGLWQWKVMAFGLRNSPATYQRLMSHVLSGYTGKFCHVFIDDIICFSNTFEEHLEHLDLIFKRLEQAGLKLKPSKCAFAKTEVRYLGHLLSPGEIRPDPSNVEKVRNLEPPTDVAGVRALVGLASYYRSFVKDFSKRASPLTELTKKNVAFHWGPEQQAAFEDLKTVLTSEPVLALPDFTKPFLLLTDGSAEGLGAVLAQQQEGGKERVIAYASKKTGPHERKYSACESECLALVWATRHFRDYILGRTTTVVTDHWALQWLLELPNANPRLQRWRMALQEYDLHIIHKPGRQHRNADFLSRMYDHFGNSERGEVQDQDFDEDLHLLTQCKPEARGTSTICTVRQLTQNPKKKDDERKKSSGEYREQLEVTREERKRLEMESATGDRGRIEVFGRAALQEAQRRDEDCKHLIRSLETGGPDKSWHRDHVFRIASDGVLEEVTRDISGEIAYKVVLPQILIRRAVQDAHAGHLKTKKTLDKLRMSYFFKHMYATCHRYVQGCPTCQEKDRGLKYQAPMGSMPEPLGAWHTVAVDVLGPLPQTRSGKKYVVVITDYLTKYVLAVATKDQTAETTATVLMEKFLEYGLPERLITDNGSNFRSKLVSELCRLLKISHIFTTPYHPQFDGLCERYNRTLAAMLRAFVAEHQRDWDVYLPYVMHAYRAAPQDSTQESPFFLMFFRPCRAPLDIMLAETDRRALHMEEIQQTKAEAVRRLHEAFRVVRHRLKRSRENQKIAHDKKSRPKEFGVGDEVYLLDERVGEERTRKLHRPWKPGYRIIGRLGPLSYLIEHPNRRGRELRVHVERLKAAIPEMVWPPDEPVTDKNVATPHQHQTELDAWLAWEKRKYKPFRSEWSWEEDRDGDEEGEEGNVGPTVCLDGAQNQNQAHEGEQVRHEAQETDRRRAEDRDECSPTSRNWRTNPRRSKRIQARHTTSR